MRLKWRQRALRYLSSYVFACRGTHTKKLRSGINASRADDSSTLKKDSIIYIRPDDNWEEGTKPHAYDKEQRGWRNITTRRLLCPAHLNPDDPT